MRLAIFSDVHSNWVALEAVLADIDKQGEFDQILFAGDLVNDGPLPIPCVEAVMARRIQGIYGNADERVVRDDVPIPSYILEHPEWLAGYQIGTDWTKTQLNAEQFAYLKGLPFSLTIAPTDNSADSLLIVHGTPSSVLHGILPSETWQEKYLKEIRQSDNQVLGLLAGVEERTIVYGHVHVPGVRKVGDYKLINVSSVSRAQDWDLRAKYAILEFNASKWQVEHHYVEYDIERAIQSYLNSDMPKAYNSTHWLRTGGEDNW